MNNIEEVIKNLREQGIDEGKKSAEKLIHEAEEKAQKIIAAASKKAKEIEEASLKKIQERETAAKSSVEIAGKNILHATSIKIAEMLDSILKDELKIGLTKNETIQKIIQGNQVTVNELLPFLREKSIPEGFDLAYDNGTIRVTWKNENYHYEISTSMILEELKANIREELHNYIFNPEK